jgi:AcrR family transcriptional regulator
MSRRIPENRLKDLLEAATGVLVAQGYRQTQMADVAAAMGVAKGTVYLYVESKEALFAACMRHADGEPPALSELDLPLPTPAPGELVNEVKAVLARETTPPALLAALERESADDVRAELEQIVRELFAISARHRTAIKLMDRSASAHPELAAVFYGGGRFTQVEQLTRYLERRIAGGQLRAVPVAAVAARFIVETITTWAVHMHWDPAPQAYDPADAEETVVQFLLGGLVGAPPDPQKA